MGSVEWSLVSDQGAVFRKAGTQLMRSVTVGGPGLVAVGVGSGVDWDAAVWTSVDGSTWNRVPGDPAVFGGDDRQVMYSVAAGGPGLVAVGYDESGVAARAAVWTSADGLTWSRVPHDEAVFGGPNSQNMESVTSGGPGLIVVGVHRSGEAGDRDAAVWWSVDGLKWDRVIDPAAFGGAENQFIRSVTAGGPGLVAVGNDDASGDGGAAAVWWSKDGLAWNRVVHDDAVFGGVAQQYMWWVTVGGPGLVAVGHDGSGGDQDAAVWTSADGITWSRVAHDETLFGGSGDQRMVSVTSDGVGVIAVGYDFSGGEYDAVVWWSDDGSTWNRTTPDEIVLGGNEQYASGAVIVVDSELVLVGTEYSSGDGDAAVWIGTP
jgi:hypothetical protein